MVHVVRTTTVARPADDVIAYLSDFAHTVEWDPGTVRCERIGAGSIAVGAQWHNVSKVLGRETELTYTLKTMDAGHLVFVGTNKTATSTDDITVRPAGSGSEITYDATIEFNGLAKLAGPLMKIVFERLGNETVVGLRKVLGTP
ncbi:polyketide cyclase [Nakamurella sp. YIM 132087]|uniref:Polyketide cyclase n=1 Tax=Nakamurella alba TaxID=2665158 RepID=A0A7K1FPJ4_9ACTN|nr:SRPBCC family protein [Nakamurella alba]MTD14744.1 polyketide cyclase [Nakamurella alba]